MTIMAAWATLMTFMTPKISVSPAAISAYIPPVRTPSTRLWAKSPGLIEPRTRRRGPPREVGPSSHPTSSQMAPANRLPGRLGIDRIRVLVRVAFRRDHMHDTVLPLLEQIAALWPAKLVPTDLALDRRDLVGMQPVGDLRVVHRLSRLHRRRHDLPDGISLSRLPRNQVVLVRIQLEIVGDELRIAGLLGILYPAVAGHAAVHLVSQRLLERSGGARPGRKINRLRLIVHRRVGLDLSHRVVEDGAAQDDVGFRSA